MRWSGCGAATSRQGIERPMKYGAARFGWQQAGNGLRAVCARCPRQYAASTLTRGFNPAQLSQRRRDFYCTPVLTRLLRPARRDHAVNVLRVCPTGKSWSSETPDAWSARERRSQTHRDLQAERAKRWMPPQRVACSGCAGFRRRSCSSDRSRARLGAAFRGALDASAPHRSCVPEHRRRRRVPFAALSRAVAE